MAFSLIKSGKYMLFIPKCAKAALWIAGDAVWAIGFPMTPAKVVVPLTIVLLSIKGFGDRLKESMYFGLFLSVCPCQFLLK